MVQQLSTNTFGCAKWVVSADATQGTHTTIAGAVASASSGDTILVRNGTYTENGSFKAGVNIVAFDADALTPNVTIIGTWTLNTAGTVSCSGIRFQTNSANCIAVTGSAASILLLSDCYINCTNNTGISFTTSNAAAYIELKGCVGDIGTTGIALYSSSSAGTIYIYSSAFSNTGNSTTAASNSAGAINFYYTQFTGPISTTSTGGISFTWCTVVTQATNSVGLTANGTGTSQITDSDFNTGTGAAISVGTGATLSAKGYNTISSTNANPITGAGTINYNAFAFSSGSTNSINTSTINKNVTNLASVSLATVLPVASGGTSLGTLTAHALYVGNGTSAPTALAVGATGTVLAGSTGADPAFTATPTLTSVNFGGTSLANYVEGSWTPVLAFGGASVGITYGTQVGRYTRIGNIVHITATIGLSNKGSSTGNATVTGLPVTAGAATATGVSILGSGVVTFDAGYTNLYGQVNNSATTMALGEVGTIVGAQAITNTSFANTSAIYISMFYLVTA